MLEGWVASRGSRPGVLTFSASSNIDGLAMTLLTSIGQWVERILGDGQGHPSSSRYGGHASKSPSERIQILEMELKRLREVFRGTAALNATLNYERVLDMALDLAMSAMATNQPEGGGPVGAILMNKGDSLELISTRGFLHADLRVAIPGEEGIVEKALNTGRLQLSTDPSRDPELGRLLSVRRCGVTVCIPLVVGLEVYGVMIFAHPDPTILSEEGLELMEGIAQQATVALQNARLYRDLEQEKERISEIQEEARRKLARDLHDGPAQSVGAIAMRVNFARRLAGRDPKSASDELYKIEELARRTSKEIRQMLFTLRPLVLESEGLVAALKDLAEKVSETHDQKVLIEAEQGVVDRLEVGKQGVIFFIVEEAVNNARKHAQADRIWIRLTGNGELAFLEVQDDGIGFDVSQVNENYEGRGSLGMINLRERSELVNGILDISSSVGQGTLIKVTIPLTKEAAERLHRPGFGG